MDLTAPNYNCNSLPLLSDPDCTAGTRHAEGVILLGIRDRSKSDAEFFINRSLAAQVGARQCPGCAPILHFGSISRDGRR